MKEYITLEDDSDFSRTFGVSTLCEEEGDGQDEKVGTL